MLLIMLLSGIFFVILCYLQSHICTLSNQIFLIFGEDSEE